MHYQEQMLHLQQLVQVIIMSLEMFKKNEKALISIDGVIQSPMAFTPITSDLEFNITIYCNNI